MYIEGKDVHNKCVVAWSNPSDGEILHFLLYKVFKTTELQAFMKHVSLLCGLQPEALSYYA